MYKWYLAKPFQAIVVNKSTVNELSKELEKQFVFYGLDENGNKCYDIVLRHENFDIVTQEYFKRNFIELF